MAELCNPFVLLVDQLLLVDDDLCLIIGGSFVLVQHFLVHLLVLLAYLLCVILICLVSLRGLLLNLCHGQLRLIDCELYLVCRISQVMNYHVQEYFRIFEALSKLDSVLFVVIVSHLNLFMSIL